MPGKVSNDNSTRSNRQQQPRSQQQQQQKRVPSTAENGSSSSVSKGDDSGVRARGRDGVQDTFQQGSSRFPALLRASSLFMAHTSKVESDTSAANAIASAADVDTGPSTTSITSTPRPGRSRDTSRSVSSSKAKKSANVDSRKEAVQQSPSSGKKSAKEAEEVKAKPAVSVRSIGIQVSPSSPKLTYASIDSTHAQAASSQQPDEQRSEEEVRLKPNENEIEESSKVHDRRQSESRPHSTLLSPPPYDDSQRQNQDEHSPRSNIDGTRLGSTAMTTRSSSSSSSDASFHHLQEAHTSSRSLSSSSSPSRVSRKTRAAINRQTSRAGIPGLPGSTSVHEHAVGASGDMQTQLGPANGSGDNASNPNSPSTSVVTSTSVPTSSFIESTEPSVSGRSASMSVSTNASSTASSSRHALEDVLPQAGGSDSHKPYCFHSGFQSSNNATSSRHLSDARHENHSMQRYLPTPPDSERKMRLNEHNRSHPPRPQASPSAYSASGQHLLLHPAMPLASPSLRMFPNAAGADCAIDPSSQAALLFAYQQQQSQQQHQQLSYMHLPQGYILHQQHGQQHSQSQPSQAHQHQQVPSISQRRQSVPDQQDRLAPPSPSDAPLVFPSLHSPSLLPSSEPTSSRSVSPQPAIQHASPSFEASCSHASSLAQHQQQRRLGMQQADLLGNLQVVQAQMEYNHQAQAQMQAHYLATAQLTPQQVCINQLQQQQQQLQQAYMDSQGRPSTPMHQSYNQPLVSPMLSQYGMHIASPIAYSPSIASPQMHSPYASPAATNWSEATVGHSHTARPSLGSISTSSGTLRRKTASMTSSDVPSSSIPPPSPLSSSTSASGQRKKGARRPGARNRVASLNENEQYLLSPNQQSRENGQYESPSLSRSRRVPPPSPSLPGQRRSSTHRTISSRMSQADADEAELADESVVSNDQEVLNSLQDISFDDLDPDKVKTTLQGMELVLERRAKELEIAKWKLKCVEVDRRDTQLEHHRALVHFAERAERAEARIRLLETTAVAANHTSSGMPLAASTENGTTSVDGSQRERLENDEEQKDEYDPFQPNTKSASAQKTESHPHNLLYSMTTPNLAAYEFSQEPSLDYPPYPFPRQTAKSKPRRRKRTSEGPSPAISLDFMRRDSLAPMQPSARPVANKSSSESLSYEYDEQDRSAIEASDDDDVEIVLDSSFSRTSSRSGTISSQAMLATPSGEKTGALGLGVMMQNRGAIAPSPATESDGEAVADEPHPSYVGSVPSFSFSLLPTSPSQLSNLAMAGADDVPSSPPILPASS